jgi:transposase
VRDLSCGGKRIYLLVEVRRVKCKTTGQVRQEKLDWLSENPHFTKRYAWSVGKRCQSSTIKDVAAEERLDWKTVKALEKEYLREKLRRAGAPKPEVIGLDEISVSQRHDYRIVVSDLERRRPIWFGGADRSAESLDLFFAELGEKKCGKIRLAVMDMWKAFENSTRRNAPQAAILYDKFHIIRHLGEALDQERVPAGFGAWEKIHQGAEIHAAVASGEPDGER